MRTRKPANISTTGRTMVSERAWASVSSSARSRRRMPVALAAERLADLRAVAGERHRRVQLGELVDAEPVAELAEQLPRRFAARLGGRQRGAEVTERRALADGGGVEHRRLHAGAAGHQDRDQLEVGGQGVAELAPRLVGVGGEVDPGVEPPGDGAERRPPATRTPTGHDARRRRQRTSTRSPAAGAAPSAAQTSRSCTYRSVVRSHTARSRSRRGDGSTGELADDRVARRTAAAARVRGRWSSATMAASGAVCPTSAAGDEQHAGTGERAGQRHRQQHHVTPRRSMLDAGEPRRARRGRPSSTRPHSAPANSAPMAISTTWPVAVS